MARLVKPLSDKEIKTAEPREKEYKLSDGKGLFIVVKIDGTKYFRFDFSYGGKRKSTSFGIYPKTTLKEAREKRDEARQLLANNINPISAKRIKKASESLTLQNVVNEWIELRRKSSSEATIIQNTRILKNINPISVKRIKRASEALTLDMIINEWLELRAKSSSEATIIQNRRMLNNITNWLGNIAIKDIKRVDIINILEKIQNKGVIETAHRLLSLMNKIYMFAVTNIIPQEI